MKSIFAITSFLTDDAPQFVRAAADRLPTGDDPRLQMFAGVTLKPFRKLRVDDLLTDAAAGKEFLVESAGRVTQLTVKRFANPRDTMIQLEHRVTGDEIAWMTERLRDLPYTVASGRSFFFWEHEPLGFTYRGPKWSRMEALGWMCAFKGEAGHAHLVSRRWLEHGPWLVLRDDVADVSLVLFHDPWEPDEAQALKDAEPGHLKLDGAGDGGYIEPVFTWTPGGIAHTYAPDTQTLSVVVPGELSFDTMLEACAIKRHQPLDKPVRQVAFVFLSEERAQPYLHALWLRDLECRAFVGGREVCLTDGYSAPRPPPPAWAEGVPARFGEGWRVL